MTPFGGDLWTGMEEEILIWKTISFTFMGGFLFYFLLRIIFDVKDFFELKEMEKDAWRYHANFSYERFFHGECKTYDGLFIDRIWLFSDRELEKNPHVMHYLFPQGEKEAIFYPYVTEEDIEKLKNDPEVIKAVIKSRDLIYDFWERGGSKRNLDVKMMNDFLTKMEIPLE
jgi:hypothetical protein